MIYATLSVMQPASCRFVFDSAKPKRAVPIPANALESSVRVVYNHGTGKRKAGCESHRPVPGTYVWDSHHSKRRNEMKKKEFFARIAILMVGLVIAHLGVTLFLLANLGADPFNVFVQGLFRTLKGVTDSPLLTHGNTHICVCFLIILVLLVVDRRYVKAGTLLCMICGGPIIDAFSFILSPMFEALPQLGFKVMMLAAGCVILAFGMTIVIKSDAGTGPNDLVAVVLSDKLRRKFSVVRMAVDFSFVAIGYALGGSFGAGTIICAFLVGPVAGLFLPFSEKIVSACIARL